MKRKLLIFLAAFLATLLMPLNAKNSSELTENSYAKKEKKEKYNIEIKYEKGMKYERVYKYKFTRTDLLNKDNEKNEEDITFYKFNISVLDVKDNNLSEFKALFKKMKIESKKDDVSEEVKETKKLLNHWVTYKKNEKNEFIVAEKSKDFPYDDINFYDDFDGGYLIFHDKIKLFKNEAEIGDKAKIDYHKLFLSETLCEIIDEIIEETDTDKNFWIKLKKVEENDNKHQIAYLKGDKKFFYDEGDLLYTLMFNFEIEFDSTLNQILKNAFSLTFIVAGYDFEEEKKTKESIVYNFEITNKFSEDDSKKSKKKSKRKKK